jgi:hypothetical protein
MPVYFIGEDENGCSPVKVGVARDIGRRKSDLQTGNPLELKLLGWITAADDFKTERDLHRRLATRRGRGEWFNIEPADVLPLLMEVGQHGFVAKNADAFEITGYDRDAIPEYLGVWEWADLEIGANAVPSADACAACIFTSADVLLHPVRHAHRLLGTVPG